jgi:hypothetical protein
MHDDVYCDVQIWAVATWMKRRATIIPSVSAPSTEHIDADPQT